MSAAPAQGFRFVLFFPRVWSLARFSRRETSTEQRDKSYACPTRYAKPFGRREYCPVLGSPSRSVQRTNPTNRGSVLGFENGRSVGLQLAKNSKIQCFSGEEPDTPGDGVGPHAGEPAQVRFLKRHNNILFYFPVLYPCSRHSSTWAARAPTPNDAGDG